MRFRRRIFASLAPLIGLSALLASVSSEAGLARSKPLIRFLQSVVQLTAPVAEYTTVAVQPDHPSVHAFLAISALAVTPFRHSLWLLHQTPAVSMHTRRRFLVPLRC